MAVVLRHLDDGGGKQCFSEISPSYGYLLVRDLRPPFPDRECKVVGYCKGLFCLEYDNSNILIWNPSNNEFKFLPPSNLKTPLFDCPRRHRNCNSYNNKDDDDNCCCNSVSHVCGLGFDRKLIDYKVVRFVYNFYDHCMDLDHGNGCSRQIEVYSLSNDCWHEIWPCRNTDEEEDYYIIDDCATSVNGFCYWIGHSKAYPQVVVVSLDLATEELCTVSLPKYWFLDEAEFVLMEFKGSLGVLIYSRKEICKPLFPWVYVVGKGGKFQWRQDMDFKVCLEAEKALGYCRNGEVLLLQGFDGKLLVYDPHASQLLRKIDSCYDYPHNMQLFSYVHTEVSLC